VTNESISHEPLMVAGAIAHGMQNDLVAALWPAIDDIEVRGVLSHYDVGGHDVERARVSWHSPRPMSSAVLINVADQSFFLKRHHVDVRSPERLRVEHDFARHLHERGIPVPRVRSTLGGDSVVSRNEFFYELHEMAQGLDIYRDVQSWHPFASVGHARSAGRALARFHDAARDFAAPATEFEILTDSTQLVMSSDPMSELENLIRSRPALVQALTSRNVLHDFARTHLRGIQRAAPLLRACTSQWGHGDWHPSNLMWGGEGPGATVTAVIDLGLANRTSAVHDLAVAIERSCVDWLDLSGTGIVVDFASLDALLEGYEEIRSLDVHEWAALAAVLPVVHVEFALSEIEYFDHVAHQPRNVELAYDEYLLGHTRWFQSVEGVELLSRLSRHSQRH
jgi:Ser/Thr protein kinase RdoA (MazF antagonist)